METVAQLRDSSQWNGVIILIGLESSVCKGLVRYISVDRYLACVLEDILLPVK